MPLLPLDGPSLQATIYVTAAAAFQLKVGASPLTERKVITIQSTNGKLYVYFAIDAGVPSAATIIADGFLVFKNQLVSLEVSEQQLVYVVSVSGTINVKIAERA